MDLAEEEHRLRDEWVTYEAHGYRLRYVVLRSTPSRGRPPSPHSAIVARLVPPSEADPGMATDACRWAARYAAYLNDAG